MGFWDKLNELLGITPPPAGFGDLRTIESLPAPEPVSYEPPVDIAPAWDYMAAGYDVPAQYNMPEPVTFDAPTPWESSLVASMPDFTVDVPGFEPLSLPSESYVPERRAYNSALWQQELMANPGINPDDISTWTPAMQLAHAENEALGGGGLEVDYSRTGGYALPENVNPAFAESFPTLSRLLGDVTEPARNLFENPWVERAGQSGAEIMTMIDNPDKASTGSKIGDLTADLWGGVMGFVGNPLSAGSTLWNAAETGARTALGRTALSRLPGMAQTGIASGAASVPFELSRMGVNDREFDPAEFGMAIGSNALLDALTHGAVNLGKRKTKAADIAEPVVEETLDTVVDDQLDVRLKMPEVNTEVGRSTGTFDVPEVTEARKMLDELRAMDEPVAGQDLIERELENIANGNDLENVGLARKLEAVIDERIAETKPKKQGIDIPIDERSFEEVGNRKVNAYQYDYPQLKTHIQSEAQIMLQELQDTVKGQRFSTVNEMGERITTGTSRLTSEPIERALENTRASYAEIADALQRIIYDEGAENQALAKRLELIIDDNLTNGRKLLDGTYVPPNEAYIAEKGRILGQEVTVPDVGEIADDGLDAMMGEGGIATPRETTSSGGMLSEGSISAAQFTTPEKMAPVGDGTKVRSLPVSAMESDINHPDVKAGLLMESYEGGAGTYGPITNKGTIEEAQRLINEDINAATRYAKDNPDTALSHTINLELLKKANAEGRYDDAIDIIEEVAKQATTEGQAIQALRMWGKMSPEGMQRYYVKTIEGVNRDMAKNGYKKIKKIVTDEGILKDIYEKMKAIEKLQDGREKDVEVAKVLDLVASQVPVPLSRKVASLQTMAQLLNPKTAIRNVVGNLGFATAENMSDIVGAVIDAPLSLITGKRSKVLPSIGTQLKSGAKGFKLGLEDALKGIDTSGMTPTKFDLPKGRVFRKGPLGFAEKALNIELRATDRAFYTAARDESLRNQMKAARVSEPTEEMINIAHLDGLYKTFQDDNGLSKLFSGFKRLLNNNKDFGIGDFVLKYPRTPANLLMRGIDYSPAGFVKFVLEAAKPLAKKEFDQKAFVEAFSRAAVGSTALFGVGALLHKAGVLTGRPVEDKDLAELQRESGFGEYRINASALKRLVFGSGSPNPRKGDKIVSYDWFAPQALSIAIGADVDANKGKATGITGTLLNAFFTGVNAFAEQPVVTGLQTLFGGGYGREEQGLLKVVEQIPSSFMPTLLNQIKQLADNQRRETYSPNTKEKSMNLVKNKTPGIERQLPKKYGTLGQPLETYPGAGNDWFNVFFNPAFTNTYNPTREMKMISDVYESTGETKHVPRVADKTITVDKQDFKLTGPQYAKYQKLLGEKTRAGFALVPDDATEEEKIKLMFDAINKANEEAKIEILRDKGKIVEKVKGALRITASIR